ncbi:MAG: GxxExxY protein [Acidobacteria bacterium]|nr:MAG: GxxExxY protein [Acidobacteriota bacterium]
MTDDEINQLTDLIIGCGIEVHKALGAGLLESVYRECFVIELAAAQLNVACERRVKLNYKGKPIKSQLQNDLVVESFIIVELKAVESIHPIHLSQVITYLKLTGCPAGLIMNFNVSALKSGIRRVDHPDRYTRKPRRFSWPS